MPQRVLRRAVHVPGDVEQLLHVGLGPLAGVHLADKVLGEGSVRVPVHDAGVRRLQPGRQLGRRGPCGGVLAGQLGPGRQVLGPSGHPGRAVVDVGALQLAPPPPPPRTDTFTPLAVGTATNPTLLESYERAR